MSTYAIIETGSKQYRVEPNTVLDVEKLDLGEKKKQVSLDHVLLVHDGKNVHIGTPHVKGAKVVCDFEGDVRGPKLISFRYRRRKNSRVKRGHRQDMMRLRVREIKVG